MYDVPAAAKRLGMHPGSLLRSLRLGTLSLETYEAPDKRTRRKYWFYRIEVDTEAAHRNRVRKVTR